MKVIFYFFNVLEGTKNSINSILLKLICKIKIVVTKKWIDRLNKASPLCASFTPNHGSFGPPFHNSILCSNSSSSCIGLLAKPNKATSNYLT